MTNAAWKADEYSELGNWIPWENKLYGWGKWAINSSSELEWSECKYGLILATEPYNHCIKDCSTISTRYVNNPFTQSWEDWGIHWTKCNILTGWTDSPLLGKIS